MERPPNAKVGLLPSINSSHPPLLIPSYTSVLISWFTANKIVHKHWLMTGQIELDYGSCALKKLHINKTLAFHSRLTSLSISDAMQSQQRAPLTRHMNTKLVCKALVQSSCEKARVKKLV